MQVSTLNLIITAQQARAGSTTQRPTASPPCPSSGNAQTTEPGTVAPDAVDAALSTPAARTPADLFAAPSPPGSQLDIRV